jgi:excisionase family DNA binding protein
MQQSINFNKLLTTEQMCELLKVSKRTLQNYRDRGTITFIQCGRKILYTESDVIAFLEAHHIKSSTLKSESSCN